MYCGNCFHEIPGGACPHCGYPNLSNTEEYPSALAEGTVLDNQYIIGRVLGQGNFGISYVAFNEKLRMKVAVKEFFPRDICCRAPETSAVMTASDENAGVFEYGKQHFFNEAQVLASFGTLRGIAAVRTFFEENGTSYFAMDYVEGISFENHLKNKGGKILFEDAARILVPVMDTLCRVHERGLIHRDVACENIFITKDDAIKLLDFGAAGYSLGEKSRSFDVMLKPGYTPKEQYMRRGRQGAFTDVYALGACFYKALTGALPPAAPDRMGNDSLAKPSALGVLLPPEAECAIMKALSVDASDRFQSMADFKSAFGDRFAEPQQPEASGAQDPAPDGAFAQGAAAKPSLLKNKRAVWISAGVAALAIVVALSIAGGLPEWIGAGVQYLSARGEYKALLANEQYAEAVAVMQDYKARTEVRARLNDADYCIAAAYLEAGEYERALETFASLGDFKDSSAQRTEAQYRLALFDYENKRFADALKGLSALGSYGESPQYLDKVKESLNAEYETAKELSAKASYKDAEEIFENIGFYKDNLPGWDEAETENKYQTALVYLKEGQYEEAISRLNAVRNDYKEKAAKLKEAKYGYVKAHYTKANDTTIQYLGDLSAAYYLDSERLFDALYPWTAEVVINNSEYDETTNLSSVSVYDTFYAHVTLSGGRPGMSIGIKYRVSRASGTSVGSFNELFYSGNSGWVSGGFSYYYYYRRSPDIGRMSVEFYNKDTNEFLGSGSVNVTW
ncbi:MAG: protein kinase [Clostridiales Family XIII bacterium]|jgi:serine/threonine protein kinase/tetratricopeptide (TPR) repeat protein|nr:protein kinase [Clostridiales Family XIII bacterium]